MRQKTLTMNTQNKSSENQWRAYAFAVALGSALFLTGCDSRKTVQAISAERTDNAQVNVELVLTNDGIKVYRFWDGWKYVYYTDARGTTSWEDRRTVGKTVVVTHSSVETVK